MAELHARYSTEGTMKQRAERLELPGAACQSSVPRSRLVGAPDVGGSLHRAPRTGNGALGKYRLVITPHGHPALQYCDP